MIGLLVILYTFFTTEIADPGGIGYIQEHDKEELITSSLENILTNHLGIKEQEFNERFLKFEINYDGESYFFEVYYQEEKINLNKNDRSEIMQETKLIMQDWISTEWDSFKVIINQWDDSFDITGHESYRYEIKPS